MDAHTRGRGTFALFVALAFLFGLGLASGLELPRGSQASPALQSLPQPAATPPEVQAALDLSNAFTTISDAVTPAVVRIEAERANGGARSTTSPPGLRDFFGPPGGGQPPQLAGGTGFLVSEDGYILTNNHVIGGADRIRVTLVDKRSFDARIVGGDPTTDVAVIKIDAARLPSVRLGDSDQARVGEWVLAIGNPGFGDASTLAFTVTGGIISAKGRPLEIIPQELQASGDGVTAQYAIEDFLQTDAVINPGNSGGPLVNLRGEVIGMNTAIASESGFYQGYGFAIPVNLARRVMSDLIRHGHVRRALLGINIRDVTAEDADVFRLPAIAGVVVEDFAPRSPAERVGLNRGDVIVAVGGERVERVGQLQRLVAQHEPGEDVEVRVVRYGESHRFRIRLTQAPLPASTRPAGEGRASRAARVEGIGLELGELTPALAREIGFERPGGAVVIDIAPTSPAARRQVFRGDRVVSINRRPVDSAREAEAMLRGARSGEIVSLVLQDRTGRTRIVNLRVP